MSPLPTPRSNQRPHHQDEKAASSWARRLLAGRNFVVLDSETTGLGSPVDFVELAVAGPDGTTLFDSLIRPSVPVQPGAFAVHGLGKKTLAQAPAFHEVYPDLLDVLAGRRVVVYNAPYDRRVFDEQVRRLGARGLLAGALPPWECAMRLYSVWVGEPRKKGAKPGGACRTQKLPGGDHSALGDVRATLAVLEKMAREKTPERK